MEFSLEKQCSEVSVSPAPNAARRIGPKRVTDYFASNSDLLCKRLKKRSNDLIAPNCKGSKERRYESKGEPRRFMRRQVIEQINAWF